MPFTRYQSAVGPQRTAEPKVVDPLYNNRAWRRTRAAHLAEHPLCVHCLADGVTQPARVVDHIDPHRGDRRKFWDGANLQSLCQGCHNRKTIRETAERRKL